MRRIACLALSVLALGAAHAGDERFPIGVPEGFTIGHEQTLGPQRIIEMVPEGENVQQWTRMITVLTVRDLPRERMRGIADGVAAGWVEACPGGRTTPIVDGEDNRYPTLRYSMHCPLLQATGKPENTWVKMVAGREALYVVQFAFRSEPTDAQVEEATSLFDVFQLCDLKRAEHACPDSVRED